jgi:hypothetical protein
MRYVFIFLMTSALPVCSSAALWGCVAWRFEVLTRYLQLLLQLHGLRRNATRCDSPGE